MNITTILAKSSLRFLDLYVLLYIYISFLCLVNRNILCALLVLETISLLCLLCAPYRLVVITILCVGVVKAAIFLRLLSLIK